MTGENLLDNTKTILGSAGAAAGTTDVDGAVIDMSQDEAYDGIMIQALVGDVTATSVLNLKLMTSDAADGSSPVIENQTGNLAAAGASNYDNKYLLLDTKFPEKTFVFGRLSRGTANAVLISMTYILYKGRKYPVTQGADVIAAVFDWVMS